MPAEPFDEPVTRLTSGRLLIGAGLVLAVGSAAILVLAEDLRWLRIGVIAALWAALVGAFIAAKYRGRMSDRDTRAADLQAIYELELEREIAARREYELRLEQDIRNEAEEKSRHDVTALRDELRSLRQTLESLLGGEVLVERYALAQSTRMRPFDNGRQLQPAPLKRIAAAATGSDGPRPEPVTERIERVRDEPVAPQPRRAAVAEGPAWPDPPSRPVPPPVSTRPAQPPRPAQQPSQPLGRPTVVPPARRAPEPPARQPRTAEQPVGAEPAAAVEQTMVSQPPRGQQPPWAMQEPARTAWEQRLFDHEPHPAELSDRWFIPDSFASAPEPGSPATPSARDRSAGQDRAPGGERDQPPARRVPEPPGRHTHASAAADESEPAGGRRRRDDAPAHRHARSDEVEPAGRRHRVDDAAPWPQPQPPARRAEPNGGAHTGADGARRSDPQPSGSHASGNSVADLLAAHGNTSPRRRRRRED